MASKSTESYVNERRLRPIYDCLDNGNNKKALQEADKLLKKQKDLQCAKVLKALALLRLGQINKALGLLSEVQSEVPTDDYTLQAMAICYRELNRVDLIADAYENASKKEQNNEDLMVALFMAYVRIGNFKKQQQTALNLYKLKPKNAYYFWAIMSVYMQAITGKDTEIANKMLLPLAQKMCKKFIDEDKMDTETEAELYLMILEKQEKYEEMLKAMDGPLARLLPNYLDFLKRRKAYLYLKTSCYKEAFDTFYSLIDNNIDQLEYYLQLFDVAFILDQSINNHSTLSTNQVPKCEETSIVYTSRVIDIITKYLCNNKKDSNSSNGKKSASSKRKNSPSNPKKVTKNRGPYIARIELYEIIKSRCQSHPSYSILLSKITENPVNLYAQFFKLFGHKGASFYDFSYLFAKYKKPLSDVCSIVEAIKSSHESIDKEPSTLDEMYRLLCFIALNYFAGKYCDMDDCGKQNLITRLIDYYDHSLKFGADLLTSDFQPPDPFVLIISYLMMNEPMVQDNSKLLNLLIILERSLMKSPSNYNSKLALIKLYNIIGAVGCSLQWFESMDIKHLQQDTLGYLISDSLLMGGHYSVAFSKINHASRFYCANYKDTFEYLVSFYKLGSFAKIEEIIKLKERLNLSINYSTVELDKVVLGLILVTKNPEAFSNAMNSLDVDLDKIESCLNNLTDNRDFSVFRVLDNDMSEQTEKNKQKWFDDQIKWIKLRTLLVKTIVAGYHGLVEPETKESTEANSKENIEKPVDNAKNDSTGLTDFCAFLDRLKDYWKSLKCDPIYTNLFPLQGPQPSRINFYRQRDYLEVLLKILDQLKSVHESSKDNKVTWDNSWIIDLKNMVDEVITSMKSSKSFYEIGKVITSLSFTVETICFAVALVGLFNFSIKKDIAECKKVKKKRNPEFLTNVNTLVEQYNTMLNELEACSKHLLDYLVDIDVSSLINTHVDLELFKSKGIYLQHPKEYQATYKEVISKLEQSYKRTGSHLQSTLSMKIKYLNCLKLKL